MSLKSWRKRKKSLSSDHDEKLISFVETKGDGRGWVVQVYERDALRFVKANAATLLDLLARVTPRAISDDQADAIEGYRQVGPC